MSGFVITTCPALRIAARTAGEPREERRGARWLRGERLPARDHRLEFLGPEQAVEDLLQADACRETNRCSPRTVDDRSRVRHVKACRFRHLWARGSPDW